MINQYKLSAIKDKGFGIIATADIPKGTLVLKSTLIRLTEKDWDAIKGNIIAKYVYTNIEGNRKVHFLCLGDAAFANHSNSPNLAKKFIVKTIPNYVILTSIDDVKNGDELCISYTNPGYYDLT